MPILQQFPSPGIADWEPVQVILMEFYETGKTKEGERAYSPLLLFKCLLLQKWFQITIVQKRILDKKNIVGILLVRLWLLRPNNNRAIITKENSIKWYDMRACSVNW